MLNLLRFWLRVFIIFILFSLFTTITFCQTSEALAIDAIDEVEVKLVSSYSIVLEAEKAGGNVSSLVARLNIACEYLANAERSFREGNFLEAQQFAQLAVDALEVLEIEAAELADSARSEYEQRLILTSGLSALSVFLVMLCGFFGWRYVRLYFVRKVLKMKPEVGENVEH